MKIKIMCTSTGCIEYAPKRYSEMGIDIIRVHVLFEGKEYLEGRDLDPVEFYKRLEEIEDPKNNLPKTAIPTPLEIQEHFDRAIAEGYDEIMVFAISSYLGGTYNGIRLVAEEYSDKIKITVVDTKITSFGEGMLAVRAKMMADEGMSSEQILKEIKWIMDRQEFIGIDAKLDYLIYNGRLRGGKAFLGQMLGICPVIHFDRSGECVPVESVRTPKKALLRTAEIIKGIIGDRSPEDYLLWHVYTGPKYLEMLKELEVRCGVETNHEDVIMSPVSGAHNGPWLAGYGYMPIRRPDEPLE